MPFVPNTQIASGGSGLPSATQPGTTVRYDSTAWRARGPYELWLEDFGVGGNITYATGTPTSAGTDCGPLVDALVTKAIALNPNRGGVTMRLDRQRYWIGTSPGTISLTGFSVIGGGTPGLEFTAGRGSTQLVVANGVDGLRFTAGGHVGITLKDFHMYGDSGSTTGNGIKITTYDNYEVSRVACSNFPGGVGLNIDGGGASYAQYGIIYGFNGSGSGKQIRIGGSATNGTVIIAPWLEGIDSDAVGPTATPVAGSIGISIESGDTHRVIAPRIHGFEVGIDHQSGAVGTEIYAMRGEWNNTHIRLGASSRGLMVVGGNFNDNLLPAGAVSIGIDINAAAADYKLKPNGFQLSKAGAIEVNGFDRTKGSLEYEDALAWQTGATGTGSYTVTNPSTDRGLNVTGDTTAQVAAVLGTLIGDLQTRGLIG